jgi:hypothetical protein
MAKRNKSSAVMVATDLGFHALVFDEHDVTRLLRAAVSEKEVKALLQSITASIVPTST